MDKGNNPIQTSVIKKPFSLWKTIEFWDFTTRLNRTKYLGLQAFWGFIAFFLPVLFSGKLDQENVSFQFILFQYFMFALMICVLPNMIALNIRRLHDINRSGWWHLLVLIPFIGTIPFSIMCLLPGTKGDNRFGPQPLPAEMPYYLMLLLYPILFGIFYLNA